MAAGKAGKAARIGAWALGFALAAVAARPAFAEPAVSVKDLPAGGDSTIIVKKGASGPLEPDFQVETGAEEISGEPVSGQKESRASWKRACDAWKKEMRELNGASLLALSCGTPRAERGADSLLTQRSTGSYKLRVRIRDPR